MRLAFWRPAETEADDLAGAGAFEAFKAERSLKRRRRLDAMAGALLVACTVGVLVNIFSLQNGNRSNFMFGLALPEAIGKRLTIDPRTLLTGTRASDTDAAPAAPVPTQAQLQPQLLAATAPPAAAVAPAAPPQSIAALITGGAPAAPAPRQPQPVVADVQRELSRRGFYDGPADGLTGPKTEAAIRAYEQSARLKVTGTASDALLAQIRRTPVASNAMLPPANVGGGDITGALRPPGEVARPNRVLGVQKTLARLGYGPLKVTGSLSPETRLAVQRFERDRGLPVDGEITDRLVRELSTVSGTAIE